MESSSDISDNEVNTKFSRSTIKVKGRSKSFTAREVLNLTELVQNHKSIIESKLTDFGTTDKKQKTWEIIANEFNSDPNCTARTADKLKKKWENLKAAAKTEVSHLKKTICTIMHN